jgi:hypothetical protein
MWVASDWASACKWGGWLHRISGGPVDLPPTPPAPKMAPEEWFIIAHEAFFNPRAPYERLDLSKSLGVSQESLYKLCVGYGWDDYRRVHYTTWPQFNHLRQVTGIIRRYSIPVADGGGNKLYMPGGRSGLHYAKNGSSLGNGPLCVVEGGSDAAALLTLGVPVLGRPSSLGGLDLIVIILRKILRDPAFENKVLIIGENDRKPERTGTNSICPADCSGCSWCWPGKYGALSLVKNLGRYFSSSSIDWRLAPYGYKDSRAWLNAFPGASWMDYLDSLSKE